jgi:5-formyltetrahydrofolate cyclo-ligase
LKTKKQWRERVLNQLKLMSDQSFDDQCRKIRESLFQADQWKRTGTVALTLSMGREVETRPIIRRAWKEHKHVVVPKCDSKHKILQFYRLSSFDQLQRGFYGLMEPDPEKSERVFPSEIDLTVVPGVVFDRKGYRIGYGGGYYDRFLSNYCGETLSLLLSCQLCSGIPVEAHDQRVGMLITEKEVIIP